MKEDIPQPILVDIVPSIRVRPRPRRVPRQGRQRTRGRGSLVVQSGSDSTSRVCGNEDLPDEFPRQPEERFFEVVVRFGRNFKVLKVLLPVERHGTGLHFSLLQ